MTRINAGIKPQELPDKLLLAEHREIKRIPNMILSGKAKIENIPDEFCLGKGHVKFFYNKIGYLWDRYIHIHNECLERGFKVTDFSMTFVRCAWHYYSKPYPKLLKKWQPTKEARQLVKERIESKGFKLLKP